MAFIDTREYYERRKLQIEYIMLRRLYYRGCPYTGDPLDDETNELWVDLLTPSDSDTPPSYIDNTIRTLIDGTVDDIYPPDSILLFGDLDQKASEALAKKLLNFGPRFKPGLKSFKAWLHFVLADVAQGGDGLLFPRLLPEKKGLRWHYYPAETWEAELRADADEAEFYRIQTKYMQEAANGEVEEIWRRMDIYKDSIRRYADEVQPTSENASKADLAKLLAIDPGLLGYMPPPMRVIDPESIDELETALSERAILEELGDFPCVVLRWNLLEEGDARGEPLATLDKLIGADDNNRLLTDHKSSAMKTGNPLLGLFDADLPPGKGEDEDNLDVDSLNGQPIVKFSSEGDRPAHWGFPENQPVEFPHEAAREALRQALFGRSQNLSVPMAELVKAGALSGFAYGQLNKYHNAGVDDFRGRLLENGVLEQLRIGMKIAEIAGLITEEEAKAEPHIQYGTQPYSPDEILKIATAIGMYKNYGVPAEELAPLLPFKAQDPKKLVEEMKSYMEQQQEMSAAVQLAKVAAPGVNGKPKGVSPDANADRSAKDAAGVDKRAR